MRPRLGSFGISSCSGYLEPAVSDFGHRSPSLWSCDVTFLTCDFALISHAPELVQDLLFSVHVVGTWRPVCTESPQSSWLPIAPT